MYLLRPWIAALLVIVSGCTLDQYATNLSEVVRWQALLDRHDYFGLRDAIDASNSTRPEKRYFHAIVSSAFNNPTAASELQAVIADPELRRYRGKSRDFLSGVFARVGEYKNAADALAAIVREDQSNVDPADFGDYQTTAALFDSLKEFPAPLRTSNTSTLRLDLDARGMIQNPATINGQSVRFSFDTGANFSVCSEAAAASLHLRRTQALASVGTVNDKKVDATFALADQLTIGDAAVANVLFLVLPDSALEIAGVDGLIGLPVAYGFPRVLVTYAGGACPRVRQQQRANLAFDGLNTFDGGRVPPRATRILRRLGRITHRPLPIIPCTIHQSHAVFRSAGAAKHRSRWWF
jgi:predicted aspartyl protease